MESGSRRGEGGEGGVGLDGDGMRRVALEEMALRRRRLGQLTPAQERAIESLLLSVADNISGLVSAASAMAIRQGRGEEACAPTVVRVGTLDRSDLRGHADCCEDAHDAFKGGRRGMNGSSGNVESSGQGRGRALRATRRQVLLGGGAALIGLTLRNDVLAGLYAPGQAASLPGVTTIAGAKKPVFVPVAGSKDPVAHSLAESLFWLDQEFEHAKFFLMHMPSPDLDAERAQVMRFQNDFADRLKQVRAGGADRSGLTGFNRPTIELVRRFLDVKRKMEKAQETGQLKSLAWPTFFEHVALEGERFANRLEKFSQGKVELDRGEVVDFWSRIMADHADFVAHLLDPEERALIEKSRGAAAAWRAIKSDGGPKGKVEDSLEALLAFKKTAQKGVEAGQIKSIIHPLLADHVVREALKFSDELKRAA